MPESYTVTPTDTTPPVNTPAPQVDVAAIEESARVRAEAAATAKIEELKSNLARDIVGKKGRYGDNGPESWDKLHDDIAGDAEARASKAAEAIVNKRLEEEHKKQEESRNMSAKQAEEAQKAEWARVSAEWSEAVQDGILPDINKDVKAKLKANVAYADLSPEEQNDPGLKAYNDALALHIKLKNEGKYTSFYRTATQLNKQPAGARAPVFGGGIPTGSGSEDLKYKDVVANRKKVFNF